MNNLRKTKERGASMKSSTNSSMSVKDPMTKISPKLKWEDLISKSERGNYSQSDIFKS